MNLNFTRLRRKAVEQFETYLTLKQGAAQLSAIKASLVILRHPEFRSFVLPENGEIIDRNTPTRIKLETCRMPFERCVLEWRGYCGVPSSDRWAPSATLLAVEQLDPGNHLRAYPIWMTETGVWLPAIGGFSFNSDTVLEVRPDGTVFLDKWNALAPHPAYRGAQDASNFIDEARVLAHFMLLCNCDNVKAERVFAPSPALVKRALERKSLPPDEYYVLDCFLGEHEERHEIGSGHHASPRFHVRRGHVRRLPNGGLTWVKQCTVGNATLGVIRKDYRVATHG